MFILNFNSKVEPSALTLLIFQPQLIRKILRFHSIIIVMGVIVLIQPAIYARGRVKICFNGININR